MQERVFANDKIGILWNTEVMAINGSQESGVQSVTLYNDKTQETTEFPTQGVFIAIGHRPNTELFKGVLDMDDVGYLKTDGRSTRTNVPGVFASGDAQDSIYRQAVTAAGTGCMAAIDAERFLAEQGHGTEAAKELRTEKVTTT
jgi:thioredoxin reductase (NADPH)